MTAAAPPADTSVGRILTDALAMYRRHAATFLVTCAIAFLPVAVVKSIVVATTVAPAIARFERAGERLQPLAKGALDALSNYDTAIKEGEIDVRALEKMEAAQVDARTALNNEAGALKDMLSRSLIAILLWGLVVIAILLLMVGIVEPAVAGALCLVVADRATRTGETLRDAGLPPMAPAAAWRLLGRRFGALTTAILLASLFELPGLVLFIVPGLVFMIVFAFVPLVVLLEGATGVAALKRSASLVASDWIRVTLVFAALAVSTFVAGFIANRLLPTSFERWGGFVGDLVSLVLMPWPVLGTVLLYLDLRRKGGLTDETLRAELAALRRVPGSARLG